MIDEDYKAYIAEFISTFTLIFIGAGSILADSISGGKIGITGIAFAHGLAIMVMVYATGHISGGHINPAVTIAMLITRKIKILKGTIYIISQLLGATVAAFVLKSIFIMVPSELNLGTPTLLGSLTPIGGIFVEAVLTFLLVFVIFAVAVDKRAARGFDGISIGLTITFCALCGGVLTGSALNPARALGPAIASGYFVNHFVYWIGPILGAIVAALLYDNFLIKKKT